MACLACDLIHGHAAQPGGTLHRTDHWVIQHCIGSLGLGTMIVQFETRGGAVEATAPSKLVDHVEYVDDPAPP
jgi:hypothetical protein